MNDKYIGSGQTRAYAYVEVPLKSECETEVITPGNIVGKVYRLMIRKLSAKDTSTIYEIINAAAIAYKNAIPADCYHEPYMSRDELRREMMAMTFYGWMEKGEIIGVMASQRIKDVTLVRHAYVLPGYQKRGVGSKLLNYLKSRTETKELLVGTWVDARWAVDFYEKKGFALMPNKDQLLKAYWDVPPRQVDTSVVLGTRM